MEIIQFPNSRDTSVDLAYTILLKLGGTMLDIEPIFASNLSDILYAIGKVISGAAPTTVLTVGANYSTNITAGTTIDFVTIKTPSTVSVDVKIGGTTLVTVDCASGETTPVQLLYPFDADQTLLFNNLPTGSTIKIYKR